MSHSTSTTPLSVVVRITKYPSLDLFRITVVSRDDTKQSVERTRGKRSLDTEIRVRVVPNMHVVEGGWKGRGSRRMEFPSRHGGR